MELKACGRIKLLVFEELKNNENDSDHLFGNRIKLTDRQQRTFEVTEWARTKRDAKYEAAVHMLCVFQTGQQNPAVQETPIPLTGGLPDVVSSNSSNNMRSSNISSSSSTSSISNRVVQQLTGGLPPSNYVVSSSNSSSISNKVVQQPVHKNALMVIKEMMDAGLLFKIDHAELIDKQQTAMFGHRIRLQTANQQTHETIGWAETKRGAKHEAAQLMLELVTIASLSPSKHVVSKNIVKVADVLHYNGKNAVTVIKELMDAHRISNVVYTELNDSLESSKLGIRIRLENVEGRILETTGWAKTKKAAKHEASRLMLETLQIADV